MESGRNSSWLARLAAEFRRLVGHTSTPLADYRPTSSVTFGGQQTDQSPLNQMIKILWQN